MNNHASVSPLGVLERLHHRAAFNGTKKDSDDLADLRRAIAELVAADLEVDEATENLAVAHRSGSLHDIQIRELQLQAAVRSRAAALKPFLTSEGG